MAENWHTASWYMPCLFSTATHFVTGLVLVQLGVLVVSIPFDLAGEPDNIFSKFHFWLFIYTKRNLLYEMQVVWCKLSQCSMTGFYHWFWKIFNFHPNILKKSLKNNKKIINSKNICFICKNVFGGVKIIKKLFQDRVFGQDLLRFSSHSNFLRSKWSLYRHTSLIIAVLSKRSCILDEISKNLFQTSSSANMV